MYFLQNMPRGLELIDQECLLGLFNREVNTECAKEDSCNTSLRKIYRQMYIGQLCAMERKAMLKIQLVGNTLYETWVFIRKRHNELRLVTTNTSANADQLILSTGHQASSSSSAPDQDTKQKQYPSAGSVDTSYISGINLDDSIQIEMSSRPGNVSSSSGPSHSSEPNSDKIERYEFETAMQQSLL